MRNKSSIEIFVEHLSADVKKQLKSQIKEAIKKHQQEIEEAYDYGYQDGWHCEKWEAKKYYKEKLNNW